MIEITNTSVMNFMNAIRGARNPMNSWNKSDSCETLGAIRIGENDLKLLKNLCKAGSDHRKFMRQIFVSVDILAPFYFWKEFDTYKVGIAANSCSTMHKIHSKPIEIEDFSTDYLKDEDLLILKNYITYIENIRLDFLNTKEKNSKERLIQMLPSNYNQLRTITCSYENLMNMYNARDSHFLSEWGEFCKWIMFLPYAKELILLPKPLKEV